MKRAGKRDRALRPRDPHAALLERLAQRLERGPRELRQLVEEQHAVLREARLARGRRRRRRRPGPAAEIEWCGARNGRRCTSGVGAEHARRRCGRASPPAPRRSVSGGRIDGRRRAAIDLPLPGGPIMSTLWPPAAATSSARFSARWPRSWAKSSPSGGSAASQSRGVQPLGRGRAVAAPGTRRARAGCRPATTSRPSTSAASPAFVARHHDALAARGARGVGHRDRAPHAAHRPVEPELAAERVAGEPLRRHLPGGRQQRRREREVEARARLAQVGGRQVHGDPPQRELEAGVDQRRPHALARLLHGGVGQAHDRERRAGPVWMSASTVTRMPSTPSSANVAARASTRANVGAARHAVRAERADSPHSVRTLRTLGCTDRHVWVRHAARLRRASMDAMAGDHRRALGRRGEQLAADPPRARRAGGSSSATTARARARST